YPSALGRVAGGVTSFRDETFVVSRIGGGWQLDYQAVTDDADGLSWQGTLGLQTPTYDRSDGLSVPVSPHVRLDSGVVALDPAVTYRSQLGVVDPSITGLVQPTRRTMLRGVVERGTFSNDRWIMSDLANSLSVVGDGADSRNWYRADRGSASIDHLWDGVQWSSDWHLGILVERAWSVGPDSGTRREPWSFVDHASLEGMLRPNPAVVRGTISSVQGGAVATWTGERASAAVSADLEASLRSPTSAPTSGGPASAEFVQGILNGFLTVPTVGAQRYHLEVHAVATEGSAPPQRWAYLGGTGTLGTLGMLQLGGDQLFLADSRYEIPISAVSIPFAGSPVLALRHVVGSAGIGHVGDLRQLIGVRLSCAPVEGELLMDTATRRVQASLGWSFVR
ncbi:MAG TPA: hypothetical protein VMH39_02135, partial [Gemmatimonadaceae bacterium]|nr:hypothetical protein [Gemmatimonadaceae bacterium]